MSQPIDPALDTRSPAERRRFRRVFFAFQVEVSDGRRTVHGRCQRVASAGLFVFCAETFPIGTTLRLKFKLPGGDSIETQGKVLKTRAEDMDSRTLGGMQILFEHLETSTDTAIRDFVLKCIFRGADYNLRHLPSSDPDGDGDDVIPIRFFGTDQPLAEFVLNISEGGAFIRTLKPRASLTQVLVDLYLPGQPSVTRIEARVAWARSPSPEDPGRGGMGLEFLSVPPEVTASLRDFVDNYGEDGA
jgi:uncharacterized protein (TIGR02266 family)